MHSSPRRTEASGPERTLLTRRIGALAGAFLLACAMAGAEEVVDLGAVEPTGEPSRASLVDLWQRREAAMAAGDGPQAESLWNDILTSVGFMGIARAEPFGVLELSRGMTLLEGGNVDGAEVAVDHALNLDPKLWSAYHVRAALALRRSVLSVPAAFLATMQGWRHRLEGDESRYFATMNAALVIAVGLGLASFAFSAAAVIRHGARFRHDVMEFFAGSFPEELTIVLGWGFLILPLLAWLGLYWATLYWIAVLVAYMGTRERVAAFLALAMAGATPLLQEWALTRAVPIICRPAPALVSLSWGLGSVGARVAELEAELGETTSTEARRFLAYSLRDAGRFDDSLEVLETMNAERPGDAKVLLDIGNVHFVEGRNSLAIHYYTEASRAAPANALPLHNLVLAYNKDMRLDLAENVKHKAESLDPSLVRRAAERGGLVIADQRPGFQELLGLAAPFMDAGAYEAFRAKRPGLSQLPDAFALGALLAIAAAAASIPLRRRVSTRCSRCHQPFCARCKTEPESPLLCAACLHVFVKRVGIASGAREAREAAIVQRASRRRGLLLGLAVAFPGLAQAARGQALGGGALALVGGIAFGALVAGRTFVEPLQSPGLEITSGRTLPMLVLALAWLTGLALAWRARDAEDVEG